MAKKRNTRKKSVKTEGNTSELSRRQVLQMIRYGALGAVAMGGAGYFGVGSFRAYAAEHDLSRVGQGNPVIVQIHDPQCPVCTSLQKQTRKALAAFDDCGLTYLVANIKTQEGAAFAARFGVPHVTLLLLDPQGQHVQTLSGMHSSAELVPILRGFKTGLA